MDLGYLTSQQVSNVDNRTYAHSLRKLLIRARQFVDLAFNVHICGDSHHRAVLNLDLLAIFHRTGHDPWTSCVQHD